MSVDAISNFGASVPSSTSQSQNSSSDAAATFTNWMNSFQGGASAPSASTAATATRFPVNLSNVTAAFGAHLSNGLTVGMAALVPVDSQQLQQMADTVEQEALAGERGAAGSAAMLTGSPSEASPTVVGGVGGAAGLYDTLPDGLEIMGYSAGTANGGPSGQDLSNSMNTIMTNLEKALTPS